MTVKQNIFLGSMIALISWLALAITSALAKLIKLNPFQILFFQNLISLCIIISILVATKKPVSFLKTKHFPPLFLRAISGLLTFFLIFIAVVHVSVADATLLLNTGPFFVPFLLFLFYKEPINHKLWPGIILGFIGIALILKPGSEIFHWASLVALLSGVGVAVIIIVLRRLYELGEPVLRIIFYLFSISTLISLPFALYYWQHPTTREWLFLLLIGISSFFSQTSITVATRYASAKVLAPLCYSSVLFALILDRLIWHIVPGWMSIVGMILVIVGGLIALYIENKRK